MWVPSFELGLFYNEQKYIQWSLGQIPLTLMCVPLFIWIADIWNWPTEGLAIGPTQAGVGLFEFPFNPNLFVILQIAPWTGVARGPLITARCAG